MEDWSRFIIEQASFNRKIELNRSELAYFRNLLHYFRFRNAATFDPEGSYSIHHNNTFRYVFTSIATDSNPILHIKLEIFDGLHLKEMLKPDLDFYDLTVEDARQILNLHLRKFRKVCTSLIVDTGWYVISEYAYYLKDLKADGLIENLELQQSLIPEFNGMDFESFFKQNFGVSFQITKTAVSNWLKLTESIKDDLQVMEKFISHTGSIYGELLQKFEVYSLEARKLF
ncbi:hypothetical protein [Leptospira sp. Fiocruz LV3954]|uniref:hypothetical protein n=1 Tax=Leptospira sp. Fiocruz LV3954 TaxID=1193012 RepID=UPI001E32708E|nr:hypothetical protein [Leptospira sp. Fiocruz LV3954]